MVTQCCNNVAVMSQYRNYVITKTCRHDVPLINILVVSELKLYIFTILGVCLCCILESI